MIQTGAAAKPGLLAIIEQGGYPNFVPIYEAIGFDAIIVNSQRKARNYLKKHTPDVIVCEYNFQSDFRDRTSNLETLMAVLQKLPKVKLVVFYMPEHQQKFSQVEARFDIFAGLPFPIDPDRLETLLRAII